MTDNKIPTCGDCTHADVCARIPYYTEFSRENPAYCKDFEQKQKWIPVTERLPENEGTYIVFTKSGCVTTARWYPERDFCNYRGEFIRHELGRFHRNATNWMPLPDPPKEEGQ